MPYLLDNDVYEETKSILQRKIVKSPILAELCDWFMETYSVKIVNFQFGKSEVSKVNGYRLYIIMETTEDYQKMFQSPFQFKEDYMVQISNEFKRLSQKYNYISEPQLANIWVRYNDFSVEGRTETNRKAVQDAKTSLLKQYSIIWRVYSDMAYGAVVFYYQDKDIMENQNNGTSKAISDEYYSLLKKYDDLNFFTRDNMKLVFDSKENVDRNFQGNLFYYFR